VAQFENAGGIVYRLARSGALQAKMGDSWQDVVLPGAALGTAPQIVAPIAAREIVAVPLYDAFEIEK
jgi:hypothetical protein